MSKNENPRTTKKVTSFTMTDEGLETVKELKEKLGYMSKAEVWHEAMTEFCRKHGKQYEKPPTLSDAHEYGAIRYD